MISDDKSSSDLQALQKLIDRSAASAGPAASDSLAYPARQMSAAEFVEFWQSVRLVAMATTGEKGGPHIAPVHARLDGVRLRLVIYDNTLRRRDIAANPRVAFTDLARRRRGRDRLRRRARSRGQPALRARVGQRKAAPGG